MESLLSFLFLFAVVAMLSVLGGFLMFFAKQTKVQKFAFYMLVVTGCIITLTNFLRLSGHYKVFYILCSVTALLTLAAFLIEAAGKSRYKFMIAKGVLSCSIIAGAILMLLM